MTIDQLDLDFPSNCMIAISGDNAAGKSTLLYAIAFCITNYKKGEKFTDYIKTGYNLARLHLDAEMQGFPLTYDVEIPRPTGKTTSLPVKRTIVYKDKTYLNNDYAQFMKEFEIDHLESLMFLFQGVNSIINVRPAERADALKRLFNFQFNDIVAKLKAKQEQNKLINLEANAVLTELKNRSFETQPLFRCSPDAIVKGWETELKKTEQTLLKLQSVDKTALDKVINDLAQIDTAIIKTQNTIKDRAQNILEDQAKVDKDSEILSRSSAQELKDRLAALDKESTEHQDNYDRLKETVDSFTYNLNLKNYELKQLLEQLKISKTGICHACGQTIEEPYIRQLEAKKDKVEAEVEKIRQDIVALNFDPADQEGKRIAAAIKATEKAKYERSLIDQEYQTLSERIKLMKQAQESDNVHLQTLLAQKETLKAERTQLETFKEVYDQKESLETRKAELESQIQDAKTKQIKNAERTRLNESVSKEKEERDKKVLELSEKMNKTLLQMNTTKASIDIFENQFPNFLVIKAAQMLEEHINLIIQKVFPEMRVKLQAQRSGVNFYYKVHEDDEEWLSISMASGAQSQILTLAYAISLSRLSGIDCLLMDEIDASMSEENAAIVYSFIASLDCFKQVFFISHKKEVIPATREINPNILAYYVNNGEYTLLD